jgi:uncharacterized protein YbjT (DUF2867 family)
MLGAEVIQAELSDPSSLVAAFGGVHGVYSVQNPMISGLEAEIVHGKNVADAAKKVGIHHLVYGSAGIGVAGTDVGSWESKLAVEAHMKALDLPVTVLRADGVHGTDDRQDLLSRRLDVAPYAEADGSRPAGAMALPRRPRGHRSPSLCEP